MACQRGQHNSGDGTSHRFSELSVYVKVEGFEPPSPISVKMDQEICGIQRVPESLVVGKGGDLRDVVVWVEADRVLGWPAEPQSESIIEHSRCESHPRVVIIAPKTEVKFINRDPILHSIRAQGVANEPVFRIHPPQLESLSLRFNFPEIVPIYSDLHPWMKSFVVVAPHQNYGVTDDEGEAVIRNIPFGKAKIKFWHATLGAREYPDFIELNRPRMNIKYTWKASSDS